MSTVPAPTRGAVPAVPVDFDPSIGLEDFDVTDVTIPRINIDHKENAFVDSLTGERHESLDVVVLGLVKQRILWAADVGDGDGPLCRSLDFNVGLPYVKEFPWKASKFPQPKDADGATLDCAACPLKEWGSDPTSDKPWCTEQYTLIIAVPVHDGGFSPALITFQRSAIKATKSYISGFARTRTPMFTAITRLSLTHNKKGSVTFSVPTFQKMNATEQDMWPDFAEQYRRIREFVQTPRAKDDTASSGGAVPAKRAGGAPAADSLDDDEVPF